MSDSTVDGFERALSAYRERIDVYLNKHLPAPGGLGGAESLHEAMRYAVAGGKRIRPVLTLAACEAAGGDAAHALPTACAIELFHAYSLVHDDLPAMDNDDERRGKPTVHRKFDEATAILVGDALLTLGFEWMANQQSLLVGADKTVRVIGLVAAALGSLGMVGGQHLDLAQAFHSARDLKRMQDLKTGALLSAATQAGAVLAGGKEREFKQLALFGLRLGQTYQLVDDLLDERQDRHQNASMLNFESQHDVRQSARKLNEAALECLAPFGVRATWLKSLAKKLLFRNN